MANRFAMLLLIFAASVSLARAQSVHRGEVAPDAEAAGGLEALKRPPRFWARGEFLLWWIKPANLPPLVTTGPFTDLRPGALDSPETHILYGQQNMDFQDRTGGRFTFGYWLDAEQIWGVNASYFFVRGRAI